MGIKEFFTQTMEDLDSRFRNPLIMTFILVWLYHHWDLVFTIFYFGDNDTRFYKVDYISRYIGRNGFYKMVLVPLLWSFVSLLAFYLIGIIAQMIKLWVGKRLAAHLMGKYDSGTFEFKTVSNKHKKRSETYFAELADKQEELNELKSKHDNSLRDIKTLHENNASLNRTLNEVQGSLTTSKEGEQSWRSRTIELITENEKIKGDFVSIKVEKEIADASNKNLTDILNSGKTIKVDSFNLALIFKPYTIWEYYIGNDREFTYVKFDDVTNEFVSKTGKVGVTNIRIAHSNQFVSFDKMYSPLDLRTSNLIMVDGLTLIGSEDGAFVKYIRTIRTEL